MPTDIVQFTITKGATSISATVPVDYFRSAIGPAMESIVAQMVNVVGPGAAAMQSTQPDRGGTKVDLSVKAICQRINAKTGTDVLKAGAVSLALVQKQAQFGRKDILAEAQKAAGYWKASYTGDAGRYLSTLESQGILIEGASGLYSLSAKAEADMLELLGS